MLDPAFFQDKLPQLQDAMKKRRVPADLIAKLSKQSSERKELILEVEKLKALRNAASQEIAQLKAKAKSDPKAAADADAKVAEMKKVGDTVKGLDDRLKKLEEDFQEVAFSLPNIPHTSVPVGEDEKGNVEARKNGNPRSFDFEPKDHVDVGEKLGIIDFERASKLSG